MQRTFFLAHPKTLVFVSHCGLNSVNEAARFGVPLLCIPMFGDQNYNSAVVNHRKVGLVLKKKLISQAVLVAALSELINNKMFVCV